MGIFKRFGGAFLIFFGVFILYFNLVMALNVVGSSNHITPFLGLFVVDNTKWTSEYYFGFESIWGAINDLPSILQYDNFLEKFSHFVDTLAPLSRVLDDIHNIGNTGQDILAILRVILTFFKVIVDILISPFAMLVAFIQLNIELFSTIIDVLRFILNILNGNYNMPLENWDSPLVNYFHNTPLPHTSNGVSTPQVASVVVSGGVVTVQ